MSKRNTHTKQKISRVLLVLRFVWYQTKFLLLFKSKLRVCGKMSSNDLNDSPAIKDYSVLEIIGTGSYSIVYRARHKQVVVQQSEATV